MAGKLKKRLRIFAGPNGSGKSTLFQNFPKSIRIGVYINADDIEKELRQSGELPLEKFRITFNLKSLKRFLENHPEKGKVGNIDVIGVLENKIVMEPRFVTSYWAAMISDFIRIQLVQKGESFSFETVLSSEAKIDFINFAKSKGYRIYLYFICTESPETNISRIDFRVNNQQGHAVNPRTVQDRYYRSLNFLFSAIRLCYRGYLFDNSGDTYVLNTEKTPRLLRVCRPEQMPVWVYQYLLMKNFDCEESIPLRKLNIRKSRKKK